MANKILIKKPNKRVYGNQYPVLFFQDGKLVHQMVAFGEDLKNIDQAYTKEFKGTKPIKEY